MPGAKTITVSICIRPYSHLLFYYIEITLTSAENELLQDIEYPQI